MFIPDPGSGIPDPGSRLPDPGFGSATLHFFYKFGHWTQSGGGGVANCEQRSSSRSRRGGVSENQIAVATAARLFFLTAVAIAIATRLFKFHEISVSNTSSSFVSSIHSFADNHVGFCELFILWCFGLNIHVWTHFMCIPLSMLNLSLHFCKINNNN